MPDEYVISAQPGRPCALFLPLKEEPDSSHALSVQIPSAAPLTRQLIAGHQAAASASGLPGVYKLGWIRAASMLFQRGIESCWTLWGLDLGLVSLLLTASLACTAPTLALLPFVAIAMVAPGSKQR